MHARSAPPKQHVGYRRVGAFLRQRRAMSMTVSAWTASSVRLRARSATQVCGSDRSNGARRVERLVEVLRRHRVRAPVVGERAERFADERNRVLDPASHCGSTTGRADHLAACVAERDQMPGQISAVHRRNVLRLQRAQVARVVPVVEVAAKALEPVHRVRASPPAAPRFRASRSSRNRGRRSPTADTVRCWWARSDAPPPASALPENCRAAACDLPPSRRSRRSATCGARSAAAHVRRRRRPAWRPRRPAEDSPIARSPATASTESRTEPRAASELACRPAGDDDRGRDRQHRRRRPSAVEAAHDRAGRRLRLRGGHPLEHQPTTHDKPEQRARRSRRSSATPDAPGGSAATRSATGRARNPRRPRADGCASRCRGGAARSRRRTAASARSRSSRRRTRSRSRRPTAAASIPPSTPASAAGADNVRRRLSIIFQRPSSGIAVAGHACARRARRRNHPDARESRAAIASRRAPIDAAGRRRRRSAPETPRPPRRPRPIPRARKFPRTDRDSRACFRGRGLASAASNTSTS